MSTIKAIHKINPDLTTLFFNSSLNLFKKKKDIPGIRFMHFNFWIVEKLRRFKLLVKFETCFHGLYWKPKFREFEYIWFIDPNQYYLLPFLNSGHKLIYLLRDPSVLQNAVNYNYELEIIKRADSILAISKNLKDKYFDKYYGFNPGNVILWPNSVDLGLWSKEISLNNSDKGSKITGMAGNINSRSDLNLLKYLVSRFQDVKFEIAGKNNLKNPADIYLWEELKRFENFSYLGYIPFNELPKVVSSWDVGLLIEKIDTEYATYFNHNKIYQYMAMGKCYVSYNYYTGFSPFPGVAYLADTPEQYAEQLDSALKVAGLKETVNRAIEYSLMNSTDKRAEEFIKVLNTL